jgi:hypothetical protein
MTQNDEPQSVAWLLMGLTGSAPGRLRVAEGKLTYTVHGRGALTGGQLRKLEARTGLPGLADTLDAGAAVTLFEVPVEAVGGVTFPWYNFGAGMKLTVAKTGYRFSFIKPQNTQGPDDLSGAADIPGARRIGRTWRTLLVDARADR